MEVADDVIARLAAAESCGYHRASPYAAEPVALAALALLTAGREPQALPLVHWLIENQSADGSVGIDAADAAPGWPTAWAVIAWQAATRTSLADPRIESSIHRALGWIESVKGDQIEPVAVGGHDPMLKGWPWVNGTHAWVEPTAMNVLALKHCGRGEQPRAREAVRLLQDRLLPSGGCNYGNTIVFGQELRPHVQPTGLCLLALAGESDPNGRIERSINYLLDQLSDQTATASLSFALLGLAAHGQLPAQSTRWLAAAAGRTLARDPGSYKLALLALASLGDRSPLIPRSREGIAP